MYHELTNTISQNNVLQQLATITTTSIVSQHCRKPSLTQPPRLKKQPTCTVPERSRRVRKVSPACARRSATHPQSRTLLPASPAPRSPHSASLGGHCRGCSLSTFAPASAGAAAAASSGGLAAASVAAADAKLRSWGAGPAEVLESGRRRRRCRADGLGFRRERRERGEARRREKAIGDRRWG
jgi:hypothetical protein